jgi:YesN/AraC family two-component response regulator
MKLYIKNMVCSRCKMAVQAELDKAGIKTSSLELGEVELKHEPTERQFLNLTKGLIALGFELIDNKKSRIIEKIKNTVVELVHYSAEHPKINLSSYLSDKLHYDYTYLSNLFSEVEGTTIEKYYISQRIEKVKELLMYDELSLSEIAYKLGYTTVAYLSAQFKKVTGLTPTFYKSVKERKRKNIEDL